MLCVEARGFNRFLRIHSGRRFVLEGNQPDLSKFIDLNMMVMTGGRERTEAEFKSLLAASGFELTRVIRTTFPVCVIEAVRA